MTGVTLTAKETSKVKNDTSVMEFPAGIPRPHMMRDWARSVDTALSAQGISDIAAKTIPDGKFDLLWPEDSLTSLPKLPKEASFGDMLAHRKYADEIEMARAIYSTRMVTSRTASSPNLSGPSRFCRKST